MKIAWLRTLAFLGIGVAVNIMLGVILRHVMGSTHIEPITVFSGVILGYAAFKLANA